VQAADDAVIDIVTASPIFIDIDVSVNSLTITNAVVRATQRTISGVISCGANCQLTLSGAALLQSLEVTKGGSLQVSDVTTVAGAVNVTLATVQLSSPGDTAGCLFPARLQVLSTLL
jgi:hypothetical protein